MPTIVYAHYTHQGQDPIFLIHPPLQFLASLPFSIWSIQARKCGQGKFPVPFLLFPTGHAVIYLNFHRRIQFLGGQQGYGLHSK